MTNEEANADVSLIEIANRVMTSMPKDEYYVCEVEHDCEKCGYSKYCNIYKIKQENWKTDWEGYRQYVLQK